MQADIIIDKAKQLATKNYYKTMEKYYSKEFRIKILLKTALRDRTERFFKGCDIYGCDSVTSDHISIFLSKDYNIAKDVMLFLEANEPLISLIGGEREYKFNHYMHNNCYEYKYPNFQIFVFYGNGKCERVKVGEKTKTIKEDIFEIKCL